MKISNCIPYILCALSLASVSTAQTTWTGLGDGTTWESAANWDNGSFYPGQTGWTSEGVSINTSDSITLSSALPVLLEDIIMLGGSLTFDNAASFAVINQPQFRNNGGTVVNINAGVFDVINGGQDFRLGRDNSSSGNPLSFNVNGGAVTNSAGDPQFNMGGALNSTTILSLTAGSIQLDDSAFTMGVVNTNPLANLLVDVQGNTATEFSLGSITASANSNNNTFSFTPDDDGITPIDVTDGIVLDSFADLTVDLGAYNIANGTELTLFTFGGSLSGVFDTVTILNGTGTVNYNPDSITLTIPEPSSAGVFVGLGAMFLLLTRRRR